MARQEIIVESLSKSRPKIDQNFVELYDGLAGIDTTVAWDEVQNKPATFPSTWDEVTGKPTIFPTNWTSVADKPATYPPATHTHDYAPASHTTRTDNPHNTTREQVRAAPVYSQTINIMADSGRFAGKVDPQSLYIPDTFVASTVFGAFNGAAIDNAGKFIHNNTTNGGTRGELSEDVTSLLSSMGRTGSNARYGVEFYICQITGGTGTAAPYASGGYTKYLLTSNGARAIFGFGNYATMVFWVRIKSGEALIIRNISMLRRNETQLSGDAVLTPSSGWAQINTQVQSLAGYNSQLPFLYAASGDVIQIAAPAVFSGQAFPGIHTAPLPSFNEQVTV